MHVAARRQDLGRPQQVAARRRTQIFAVKGADNGVEFVVAGEKTVGLGEIRHQSEVRLIRPQTAEGDGGFRRDFRRRGRRSLRAPARGRPRATAIAVSRSMRASGETGSPIVCSPSGIRVRSSSLTCSAMEAMARGAPSASFAVDRSRASACSRMRSSIAARSPGASAPRRQRSRDAFRSMRPLYNPAWAMGGVR